MEEVSGYNAESLTVDHRVADRGALSLWTRGQGIRQEGRPRSIGWRKKEPSHCGGGVRL